MIENKKNTKNTVNKLIMIAIELFAKLGYSYTSVSDIANKCQLSKASIYHYVDSKADLAKLCIQESHKELKEQVLSLAYDDSLTVNQRFSQFVNGIQDYFNSSENAFFVMKFSLETAFTLTETKRIVQDYFVDLKQAFVDLISEMYDSEKTERLVSEVMCIIQGAIVMYHIDSNNNELARIADIIFSQVNSSI